MPTATAKEVIAAEKVNIGVYISGLFLEGDAWNEKDMNLIDSPKEFAAVHGFVYTQKAQQLYKKGQLNMKVPIIHFIPCENKQKPENYYECPVYKTPAR